MGNLFSDGKPHPLRLHPQYRMCAWTIWLVLVSLYMGVMLYVIINKFDQRSDPPISLSVENEEWGFPTMYVCSFQQLYYGAYCADSNNEMSNDFYCTYEVVNMKDEGLGYDFICIKFNFFNAIPSTYPGRVRLEVLSWAPVSGFQESYFFVGDYTNSYFVPMGIYNSVHGKAAEVIITRSDREYLNGSIATNYPSTISTTSVFYSGTFATQDLVCPTGFESYCDSNPYFECLDSTLESTSNCTFNTIIVARIMDPGFQVIIEKDPVEWSVIISMFASYTIIISAAFGAFFSKADIVQQLYPTNLTKRLEEVAPWMFNSSNKDPEIDKKYEEPRQLDDLQFLQVAKPAA